MHIACGISLLTEITVVPGHLVAQGFNVAEIAEDFLIGLSRKSAVCNGLDPR